MANQFLSCNVCSTSDPAQDTVKVDPKLLASSDKENTQPLQLTAKIDDKPREQEAKKPTAAPDNFKNGQLVYVLRSNGMWSQGAVADSNPAMLTVALQDGEKQIPAELIHSHIKVLTEEQRQQAEEEVRRQKVEREAAEQAQVALKAAKEKAAAAEEKEAAAAAAAEAEEQRLRQEAEEAARAADEHARNVKREAAECAAELAAAEEKVSEWCKSNGYADMTLPKKTLRSATKFPLHTAVKQKNEEMIGLLMRCGADQSAVDSKKQSPSELAAKLNKNGSHDQILAMLR